MRAPPTITCNVFVQIHVLVFTAGEGSVLSPDSEKSEQHTEDHNQVTARPLGKVLIPVLVGKCVHVWHAGRLHPCSLWLGHCLHHKTVSMAPHNRLQHRDTPPVLLSGAGLTTAHSLQFVPVLCCPASRNGSLGTWRQRAIQT